MRAVALAQGQRWARLIDAGMTLFLFWRAPSDSFWTFKTRGLRSYRRLGGITRFAPLSLAELSLMKIDEDVRDEDAGGESRAHYIASGDQVWWQHCHKGPSRRCIVRSSDRSRGQYGWLQGVFWRFDSAQNGVRAGDGRRSGRSSNILRGKWNYLK
jgi:hypothetical protein